MDPGVDIFSDILRSSYPDFVLTADTTIAEIFSCGAMDFSKITILVFCLLSKTSQHSILLASTRRLFVFTDFPLILIVARVHSCCTIFTGVHSYLFVFCSCLLMFYSCSTCVHFYLSMFIHLCSTGAPSCSYSCGVSSRSFYKAQFV